MPSNPELSNDMQPRAVATAYAPLLENMHTQEVMQWVAERFGNRAGLSCSFGGPGGMILAHMASLCEPKIPVLFIDTDFLFPETYTLMKEVKRDWGLVVRTRRAALSPQEQSERHGPRLWERQPDLCCHLRKVEPMKALLQGVDCWVTGLRRDQSATRANTQLLEAHTLEDGREILKVNPLVAWTRKDVWAYIHEHHVPYNRLLDEGFTSLGCTHCTARATGTDERAGRWKGSAKTECGLHTFTRS